MTPVTRSRLIILTVAAAVVVFFLHLLGALSNTEAWLMRKLSVQEARLASASGSFRQWIVAPFQISRIFAENDRLRAENAALLSEKARLTELEAQNESLRQLLEFSKKAEKPPIAAHVLARTPEAGTHTLLLDKGSDDGVLVEQPVIAENGVIVGKIFKVERTTALALLLTDTRSRLGASVENVARTQGIVQGERGLSLEMRLIPQNEEIAPGDIVVTSGIEPLTPRGLVIGRVEEVQTQEKSPFKKATLISPVAFDRLDVVAIVIP